MRLSLAGIVCWSLLLAGPALAADRFAIVVTGAPGGEQYAEPQQKTRDEIAATLRNVFLYPASNVVMLGEGDGAGAATADNIRRLIADLRPRMTRDDQLLVVLIGHGTYDGVDAKFNLVGPDLTARDWRDMLAGLPGQLVFINTTESSFAFVEALAAPRRVVIAATDSAAQRYATVFPQYLVEALADLGSDLDKNGRMSVWEAFTAASLRVKRHYEQLGRLSTERSVLDDTGDGLGREADMPGGDGQLARRMHFDPEPGTVAKGTVTAGLEARKRALELELDTLRARRSEMRPDEYESELERLLVQIARLARQIRNGS